MREEVINGKSVWTFNLKEFVGNDPLAQIDYEREMEWKKMLREGKTREEIEAYMATTDYEERIEKILYPQGKKKEPEIEIGDRVPIYRLCGITNIKGQDGGLSTDGKCGNAKINGKNVYRRCFIKRIGYETYLGNGLWALEFDNATEEEFEEYMARNCVNEAEILNNKKNKE